MKPMISTDRRNINQIPESSRIIRRTILTMQMTSSQTFGVFGLAVLDIADIAASDINPSYDAYLIKTISGSIKQIKPLPFFEIGTAVDGNTQGLISLGGSVYLAGVPLGEKIGPGDARLQIVIGLYVAGGSIGDTYEFLILIYSDKISEETLWQT